MRYKPEINDEIDKIPYDNGTVIHIECITVPLNDPLKGEAKYS